MIQAEQPDHEVRQESPARQVDSLACKQIACLFWAAGSRREAHAAALPHGSQAVGVLLSDAERWSLPTAATNSVLRSCKPGPFESPPTPHAPCKLLKASL